MTSASRTRRKGAYFVAASAVVSATLFPTAAIAGGVAVGDCRLGDTQFLEGEPGFSQSQSQICGGNYVWGTEATWYWTDEKLVIVEPRALAFDYSAYGGIDPFSTEYSLRKANELFPDTSTATAASDKLQYATASLGAKPQAIQSRNDVTAADACTIIPPLYTDTQIREEYDRWLAPAPLPGGPAGRYTYELSPNLTAEQRAVVLDAVTQFAAARGPRMAELVPRGPGDPSRPTITFADGSVDPDFGDDNAAVVLDSKDTGRDGLSRWVHGTIEVTRDLSRLSPQDVGHEIAHVYQFDDTLDLGPEATMGKAPSGQGAGLQNPWKLDGGTPPKGADAYDKCLKQAFQKY